MPRTLAALSLLLTLGGCGGGIGLPAQTWIAPLDGQTAIPLDAALHVHMGDARIPEGYEVPEMIRVKDLAADGFVPGQVEVDEDELRFTADGGWEADHRYAWIFDPVDSAPHGPEFEFPDATAGAMAVFDTGRSLQVLGVGVDELDRPCLVLSRRLDAEDDGELRITANDVELEDVGVDLLAEDEWSPFPEGFDIDIACIDTATPLSEGAALRVWWGDAGPWRAVLGDEDLEDTIVRLARGNY